MNRRRAICAIGVAALAASGCFGAQARTVSVVPMDVPAPPPRVVEVNRPEPPPIMSLPEEPARTAPPRTPAAQPETPRPVPARPGPVADVPKPPDDTAKAPGTTLQTTSSEQGGEVERRIRAKLGQATADLGRINYQGLDQGGRAQFDTARRFIGQAEEALRARNLVFASNLSEKAASLAAQLVGR